LEEAGAEVLVVGADVACRADLERVKAETLARFGALHGVIHAAGVAGGGLAQGRTREAAQAVLAPKVQGTLALDAVLAELPLDFLVLFSSVTSIVPPAGQLDYAAANAFLDAFAHQRTARGRPTVAIDWDAWREVGMAASTEVPAELRAWREESLSTGLDPREGVEAFDRILRSPLPQVVVSRLDFAARLADYLAHRDLERLSAPAAAGGGHPRPDLPNAYVEASTPTERGLAEIWQEQLALREVGINDSFFDLGGNSLVGLKVLSSIKERLGAALPPVALFENPTIKALARAIEAPEDAGGEADEESRRRGAERRQRLRRRRETGRAEEVRHG
jgi:NAD(P)-dependent dehydrogenase (short-subunit alcohol dehydrogenase family)/acyl carrier protein